MTIYAIPDIHGYDSELARVHDLIAEDRAREGTVAAPVVHLGDLNDRGPDTSGVIDRMIAGIARNEPWIVLRGNHDRMFLNFVRDGVLNDWGLKTPGSNWLHPGVGGRETLASYGIALDLSAQEARREARDRVPQAHLDFLAERPLWHETDELLFVHAGIRPGICVADQSEDDLVWIRDDFLFDDSDHGWLVVHGHTALEHPTHFGNRVDLDAGAGYGRPLAVAVFEGRKCWLLSETGRIPLLPAA